MKFMLSLFFSLIFCLVCVSVSVAADEAKKPNVVIIFADDLGYGDLSCYGHPTINTPNLDKMAKDGQRWTSFYVAASMCTPSRAGLMTGRLPIRNGMCSIRRHVLYPNSGGGLPQSEVTLAEMFKDAGYKTACVGKWHLGHLPQFLPCKQGFDQYFGLPYSNDMSRRKGAPRHGKMKSEYFTPPLMRDDKIIEQPAQQETLTKRYTAEAIKFIEKNKDQPFFLYLAQTFPHTPLFRSKDFVDHSQRGLFGDAVEEVDWSVGQILDTLQRLNLDKNTLVVFTSDN
ncbi:MAG: sulfatase-like hydrolase/transferase, partial [Planctomycetia bacterium]